MEWKLDKTLGYMYAIDRTCPYASKGGKVYQHHYVMCNHIGRPLELDECVHHIDRNRVNNNLENLMLLTKSEHMKLHAIEDRSYRAEERKCLYCGNNFTCSSREEQKYCTEVCSRGSTRKFDISPKDLEVLVWSMPTSKVAEFLDVSDVAIGKRCKRYDIEKPGRGYWEKEKHMISHVEINGKVFTNNKA